MTTYVEAHHQPETLPKQFQFKKDKSLNFKKLPVLLKIFNKQEFVSMFEKNVVKLQEKNFSVS